MSKDRRYSFFKLFTKGDDLLPGRYKLVIPIIQRDYAQGRASEKAKEVRNDFLSQLYCYMNMTTLNGSYDLDFVYGTSSPSTDSTKKREFCPLDGQQRLTTLFLIHLYLAVRTKGSEDSIRFFKTMQSTNGNLVESLFTYRTRSSSVEFCNCLIDVNDSFAEVFDKDANGNRKFSRISDFICNSGWFYPDWIEDPTVKGMLTMLDAIDDKFHACNHQTLLHRLMSNDDPSITFIFMDLDDYKLTDDLYIKINSRGKPLTPFENFKAKYEQYIGRLEKEVVSQKDKIGGAPEKKQYDGQSNGSSDKLYALSCEIKRRNNTVIGTVKDNFAFNIDTKWSGLFWKFSKLEIEKKEKVISETKGNNGKTLDKLLSETLDLKVSRFIKMVLVNQYAIAHKSGNVSIPGNLIEDKALSFSNLEEIGALSADGVVLMTRMFEMYSNRPMEIMPAWTHAYYNEETVFESMINNDKEFSYIKRFMQYAYTMFRMKLGDDQPQYLVEWMRFLHNMTLDENSIQDITINTYHRAISSVNTLFELLDAENPSIIQLLSSDKKPLDIDFFPKYQYREEILKSYLFKKNVIGVLHQPEKPDLASPLSEKDSWETLILKLESHEYFKGQIGFILKMAGIDENSSLDWNDDEEIRFKRDVIRYGRIASEIFAGGYRNRRLAKNAVFERAMLATHPEYLKDNFLNSKNVRCGSHNLLRDLSWKSFLRLPSSKQEENKNIGMVKKLFDQLDPENPISSLSTIIKGATQGFQWQKDIIKYEDLMKISKNGYFAKAPKGHIILKNSINFSKDDCEVYSYVLFLEYLRGPTEEVSISNFSLDYKFSNSWNEVPYVKLSYKDKDITVKIKSCVDANGELECHCMSVDSNANKNLETFLKGRGFTRKQENDSIFTFYEKPWSQEEGIDEYRKKVSKNVKNFISAFGTYLRGQH